MDQQNRNLILATALSFLVVMVWTIAFPPADSVPEAPMSQSAQTGAATDGSGIATAPPSADTTASGPAPIANSTASREDALATSARIAIDTPRLTGSIALTGARIDDLALKDYREELDPESPLVKLLSPAGTADAYYALHGWAPAGGLGYDAVPGADTPWTPEDSTILTPQTPVTLWWDNGAGLTFRRTISVDNDYMFTVDQQVQNNTGAPVRLAPYGVIARHGEPETQGFYVLHEGVVSFADGEVTEIDYSDMPEFDIDPRERAHLQKRAVSENGWIGFTDKYWMTTLIAPKGGATEVAKYVAGSDIYQTDMRLDLIEIAPGTSADSSSRLFAGAKEWEAIRSYQEQGVTAFVDSIDWGWFYFLTKPIFQALHFFNKMIGNMGVAIILLTLAIKTILFPLAYKSYVSMARMKELQPEMEKIKERAGDNKTKMQQEIMALYKEKKVNPAAGCLPILVQIPIFFSLYKVIIVTLELRHAPFFGWIQDLSAPDPTSWMNLFGLMPYEIPSFLALFSIGVFPLLMGLTMWLQQRLNPMPPDPTQAMIFNWMPFVFMFMLGSFASGLVIYWVANNTITFLQQFFIMRSQGVKPDLLGNIRGSLGLDKKDNK